MGWLLRTAAMCALAALIAAMVAEPREAPPAVMPAPAPTAPPAPTVVRPVYASPPMVITLPPEPGGALGPCPATEPPRDASVPIALDRTDLVGATAARHRAGWLAGWSSTDIYLSTDDGRSFARVLEGPGQVRGVAIDCHGRVFALRDGGLVGVRHGNRESWQVLARFQPGPDDEYYDDRAPTLVADGGVVAIAGATREDINEGLLMASVDGGATWKDYALGVPGSWEGIVAMNVDARGRVRLLSQWGDCMVDGSQGHIYDPARGLRATHEYDPYLHAAFITDGGWVFAPSCETADAPCAWDARGRPVEAPRISATVRERLRPGDRMLAQPVDHGGRVLALEEGRLIRWSRRQSE